MAICPDCGSSEVSIDTLEIYCVGCGYGDILYANDDDDAPPGVDWDAANARERDLTLKEWKAEDWEDD